LSWAGTYNADSYEAYVEDSSGETTSKTITWGTGTGNASVTFNGLALGTYTVWVNSIEYRQFFTTSVTFGEQSCTVTEEATGGL